MTRDDIKEACRLLLAAGVPRDQITQGHIVVANELIKAMARDIARRLIKRLFPE
jgi:hypothetical protein